MFILNFYKGIQGLNLLYSWIDRMSFLASKLSTARPDGISLAIN
jgi:hypothetical protein